MLVPTLGFMKSFLLLAFLSACPVLAVVPLPIISFSAIRVWGIGVGVVV